MTDEIERRARLIAGALYAANADALVFSSATRIGGMIVCPERTEMMPLWMLYLEPARVLIADEERRLEEALVVKFADETMNVLFDRHIDGYGQVLLRQWPGQLAFWVGGRMVRAVPRETS